MTITIGIMLVCTMIFCHILDDYFLQGMCLSNLKQKSWWQANANDELYSKDYIMALSCHAFSWAFMIMLPLLLYSNWNIDWFIVALPVNAVIYAIVDDVKANRHKINLIQDQVIHLIQIAFTFALYCILYRR